MKRLLPSLSLTALLLATMGVGPCGSQPLGSVDGGPPCNIGGKQYAVGASFPAADGCNTCTCQADGVACTTKGCPTDGPPTTDAGIPCTYQGKAYSIGSKFPSADGCNTCTCDSTGSVACTLIGCAPDAGVDGADGCNYGGVIYKDGESFLATDGCNTCGCSSTGIACTHNTCADAGTGDGGATCQYLGKPYPSGATFPAEDGCNTCSCTSGGLVACTLKDCPTMDAGTSPPACTFGQDQTCNEDPVISSLRGTCLADGTCKCSGAASPATGRCLNPGDAGKGCELGGLVVPIGDQVRCPDGCGTCTCVAPGSLKPNGDCGATSCSDILFTSSATCLPESAWNKTATSGCAAIGKSLTKTLLNACTDPTLFGSGSYKCCDAVLPCGNSSCKPGVEYCVLGSVKGADQTAACRPYSAGCTTCACASLEATANYTQTPACSSIAPTCTDGVSTLQPADTSATLVVSCTVP